MNAASKNSGFTLIEVSFAVLIVGLGLLTIFSLFPNGLRLAEDDTADTKCALFSQRVFSGLHANASRVTSAVSWTNGTFKSLMGVDVLGVGTDVVIGSTNSFSFSTDEGVRYFLSVSSAYPYGAKISVWYGLYGSLSNVVPAVSAYTEFYQSYMAK